MNTYQIQLGGQVDVNELNALSPHRMIVIRVYPASTWVSTCTDQSGMLGLLRHLHNLGLMVLAVTRQGEAQADNSQRMEE